MKNNSVNNNSVNNNIQKRSTRAKRAATMLCAVLAGLGLARGASAQGPQTGSPTTPTAYQSPLFHSGGSDPALVLTPPFTPPLPTPPFLNPLYGQLQGTPTETVAVPVVGGGTQLIPVQIPSFLLGAYDPVFPPAGIGTYYPEHFADGQDPPFSWNAPFSYVPVTAGLQIVDDSAPAFTDATTSGFTYTSGWEQVTSDGTAVGIFTGTTIAGPAAGTATNGEYLRLPPKTDGAAVWQILEPTAGSYTVNVNIPNANDVTEPRSSDVSYAIVVRDASGIITFSGTSIISQTEANANQFLGGPFQVVANGTVTVTLERNANRRLNNTSSTQSPASNYYLVADSVTLQIATGDVQSTPTAINRESFPLDFARAKYWGIQVAAASPTPTPQTVGATAASNSVPDTNTITGEPVYQSGAIVSTDPNTNDPNNTETVHAVDALHKIRQLVYFGRREPILTRAVSLDDSQGGFSSSPPVVPFNDPSATAGEYRRYGAAAGAYAAGSTPVASWTLTVPPTAAAAGYFVNVHLPRTQPANANGTLNEIRLAQTTYTVTDVATNAVISGPVTVSQQTFGTDRIVTLPTGALTTLTAGQNIKINLFNVTGGTGQPPANTYVVADSVSLSTGNGKGAVYCVDGFTGGVVWRYEIPSTLAGDSSAVYSSPVVARVNVLIAPAGAGGTPAARYANRLVVIVGDNNGLLYCLDAIGNGDGTSNFNSLDVNGQPIYGAQPSYAPFTGPNGLPTNAPLQVDAAGYATHVGTTGVYWVYRPDPNAPKDMAGAVKKTTDVNSDLPVPAAFNTASATVFVDPNVPTASDATGSIPVVAGQPVSNAIVYVGNSNGVLYALDALGVPTGGATLAAFQASGEKFNSSLDIRRTAGHYATLPNGTADPQYNPADTFVPTPQPMWWFTLRGPEPNSPNNTSFAAIESAPSIHTIVTQTGVGTGGVPSTYSYVPTVFIGSAHEMEANSNVGRLYALDGLLGPSSNNGQTNPNAAGTTPGSTNYNVGQRPQTSSTDAAHWSFPDAYDTTRGGAHTSSNKQPRPALGNVSGSPVVFTNTHETQAARRTRVYFAANSGLETTTDGVRATTRPDENQTGRVWAVNLDGTVGTPTNSPTGVWAFPSANDPNLSANDTIREPSTVNKFAPLGSFLHATPAMGFVQFPSNILNGDGNPYTQTDTTGADVKGRSVPMLYVATRGVNDTALYALNIDGGTDTQRQVYRQPSFDGSIFQSSPVLITNGSSSGGNGGSVFVTAGSSFFDYSATPISNPIAGQAYPLIRLDKVYTSYGPFSSPTVAATETTDFLTATEKTAYITAKAAEGIAVGPNFKIMTDWVYVGDSTLGFCRGFTPRDSADAGIPTTGLSQLIPPDPNAPASTDLSAPLQAYLVNEQNKQSNKYSDHLPFGPGSALPVYEWGQNVYIRFANAVPPTAAGSPTIVVFDRTKLVNGAIPDGQVGYGDGGPLEFDLSDATQGTNGADATQADHAVIPPIVVVKPTNVNSPLPNGFIQQGAPDTFNVLQDTAGKQYIGAYTYTIADGSARLNTPGSRRRVINATQTVKVYTSTNNVFTPTGATTKLVAFSSNGNEVSTHNPGGNPSYKLTLVPPVDQPTFGILNPLGVRGGGMDLLGALSGHNPNTAIVIGDELGPFRGIGSQTIGTDPNDLKALANGNEIPVAAPPSSSGGGGSIDPTRPRQSGTAFDPNTTTNVVVTSTGLIAHNTTGDNVEALPAGLPPLGTLRAGNGLNEQSFGSTAAPYSMDLFDRSALGVIAQGIRAKANTVSGGGDAGLYWNDNTVNATGHDSVVNYLPWETPPPVGSFLNGTGNSSQDYPNISPSNISVILHQFSGGGTADMSLGQAFLVRSAPGASPDLVRNRTVYGNPVQFHVTVPRFQSANQQLYTQFQNQGASGTTNYNALGQIAPVDSSGNTNPLFQTNNNTFPMGYVTTRRIYVPDRNGFYRQGAAFREVRVYTGVPPSYTTHMDTTTAVVGSVPSSFGIQTSQYLGLTDATGVKTFDPYNQQFQKYYVPLKITNTGNVNLLNVHLNQKRQDIVNGQALPGLTPLKLQSDALDTTSFIPGFDQGGALTGPRSATFTLGARSVPEDFFLIRSSLDSDLATVFGRNPLIAETGYSSLYPGATFHKAQVGSAQPSTLTVPDAPDSFVPGASLNLPPFNHPTHGGDTSSPDPNNPGQPLPYKTEPFVSVAVPFGTPVGSYFGSLQLFEGLDSSGYPATYDLNQPGMQGAYTGLISQIFPPRYGSATGGIAPPATDSYKRLSDTIVTAQSGQTPAVSLMPNSSSATVLNVNVVEDRMTDGSTNGAVPMVDQGAAIPPTNGATTGRAVPDFAPAAYRDPNTGNLSVYWTSGRGTGTEPQFNIFQALVPTVKDANGNRPFLPIDPAAPANYVNQWWTPLASETNGYKPDGTLKAALAVNAGTNSGLTITQDAQVLSSISAFSINVQAPPLAGVNSYQNTLLYYPVAPATGALGSPQVVTNDPSQVKYGVKGLSCLPAPGQPQIFPRSLWAFWTATTRGRTAIYYNSMDPTSGLWIPASGSKPSSTTGLLPIPAGLTAVADPAPLLVYGNIQTATGPQLQATIEVTYSGTAPTGNVDLYQSRYQPDGAKTAQLDLVPYPAVTEILSQTGQPGSWYQARDVAWSRTSQLNLFVGGQPVLYGATNQPLFSHATFDKASGLLVLTGVTNPTLSTNPLIYGFGTTNAPVTAYIDLATGRARFSATPNATVTAFFSPLAKRITADSRADTGPVTFLDGTFKANDAGTNPSFVSNIGPVVADRRWYVWRKSGTNGAAQSATIYYKTQRLTAELAYPVDPTQALKITLNGTPYTGPVDVHNVPAVLDNKGGVATPASARLYFPINLKTPSGAEGEAFTANYTQPGGTIGGTTWPAPGTTDTVQWQDEIRSNDVAAPPVTTPAMPLNAISGLATINPGYLVPLDTTINENNVSAFLDTAPADPNVNSAAQIQAGNGVPHKVWLFWNSTRNGTADVYYETINPLFAAAP